MRPRWFHALIRFVDRDMAASRPGQLSLAVLIVLLLIPTFISRTLSADAQRVVWGLALPFVMGWIGLILWRGYRAAKAGAAKGDRAYDRRIKHGLPPEYADTESATAARKKRVRRKR